MAFKRWQCIALSAIPVVAVFGCVAIALYLFNIIFGLPLR